MLNGVSKHFFVSKRSFWFCLSLAIATFYIYLNLLLIINRKYVVQDDARQHVFWMMRFLDPKLFSNDVITDYFQSVATVGYRFLYRFVAVLGINPLLFHKILPSILALISTGYAFGVCLEIFPIPLAGFITALLLNQHLWMEDNLSSATPRAFLTPLLLAFLYYLLRGAKSSSLGATSFVDRRNFFGKQSLPLLVIVISSLFYPHVVLVASGVLIVRLLNWENGKLKLSENKQDYWICGTGLVVAFLVLFPYVISESQFGSIVDLETAKTMPEFYLGGRTHFFDKNIFYYWLAGERSGIFTDSMLMPFTLVAALFLPFLMRFPGKFPLVKEMTKEARILGQLTIVAFGLFFLAHALLFHLYLPSRYTQYILPFVLVFASAIALTVLLDAGLRGLQTRHLHKKILSLGLVAFISLSLIFYPSFLNQFPQAGYKFGNFPSLYQFFAQQPKDILIASLSPEADNIPSFTLRSVLVSKETAIALYPDYYSVIRQRILDLIEAQYSPKIADVKNLIQKYDIDFWLLDKKEFSAEYLENNNWLQQFQPVTSQAQTQLSQGDTPALLKATEFCSVWQVETLVVLDAECLSSLN